MVTGRKIKRYINHPSYYLKIWPENGIYTDSSDDFVAKKILQYLSEHFGDTFYPITWREYEYIRKFEWGNATGYTIIPNENLHFVGVWGLATNKASLLNHIKIRSEHNDCRP